MAYAQRSYCRTTARPENPPAAEDNDQKSGFLVLQKTKDLMGYLYTSFVKYPKCEKLSFVNDYKQALFEFTCLIIRARKKYFKKTTLQDADVQLELLRLFNDLSYDMHFIDEKRYLLVSDKINEIGRLLGGWIKSHKESGKAE